MSIEEPCLNVSQNPGNRSALTASDVSNLARPASTMSDWTASQTVRVVNPEGLHVRAAGLFVRVASRFQSEVAVTCDHEKANGKGILDLLTLGAGQGTDLVVSASGPDAESAVDALVKLVAAGFQEQPPQ